MDINAWEGLDVYNNLGDVFLPDDRTSAVFTTPWWRCGKWCKIVIETGDAPLTVEKTEFAETRAPAAVAAARHCRNGRA